jgi:uncharacterized DUF497 family protein
MLIIFDEPKRLANIEKHGFDFAELDVEFFEGSVVVPAKQGRLIAIGVFRAAVIPPARHRSPLGNLYAKGQ